MEKRKPLSMQQLPKYVGILLAAVLVICLSTAPVCQGSLVQKRSALPRHSYQFFQNWETEAGHVSSLHQPSSPSHVLKKRDTTAAANSSDLHKPKSTAVSLNDSHNQLLVFWAGEDVIVCLAKDAGSNTSSNLWISRDYGGTFSNATSLLIPSDNNGLAGVQPFLQGFFNHPSSNGHFALSDVHNKIIFITRNYGAEFTASKVEFSPDEVLFDPHSDVNIVAYETTTTNKQMWVSVDFGVSWTKVQEHVKSLYWDETVMPANLYLQREEPSSNGDVVSRSVILKSDSLFLDAKNTEVIITGVEEFEVKDDFMFATKLKENGTYDLLISYNKSEFRKAIFPTHQVTKHFFIADVSSDGQIFVCVVQNESISNLYIGSFPVTSPDEDPKFSLSLERILYFKPNVTWPQSWLNEVTTEPFVDLNPVEGLRGVYIASQLKESTVPNPKFSMNEVISLITYDQGGEWQVLHPPEFEHDGMPIYCQYKSDSNCSLHISQKLSELYPRTRAVPILTRKSAVGMVLATGTVNTTLKGHLGVYLSTDGAVSWRQILQGNYVYAFGDHGGIIVATKMYKIGEDTNEILYSIDEGETWGTYQFHDKKVRIMGLMTEPGENTTVFFIFGSIPPKPNNNSSTPGPSRHTWVLIKVDFRDVFERNCTKDDYKLWSPWDANSESDAKGPQRQCLLGRKEIYERRIPTHKCYNGRSYVRSVTNKTCACARSDFECDFGYVVDRHSPEKECIKDNSETSPGVKAEWCRPSDKFYNKTKGYRKVPGDVCDEGSWVDKYLSEQIPCEVKQKSEFLLVAKRDSVLRIDMNHYERVETLPLTRVLAVIAVDFNLKNNCIFWSDVQRKTIMMLHLDGQSTPETLVNSDISSVEGLAFDWMANNLYFTDGSGSKIEVVKVAHSHKSLRRRLLSKPDVEKPRGIAVHPEKGYIFWTDWSTNSPAIGRAHLDGSNPKRIVQNNDENEQDDLVLKWPNGITIDFVRDRLFWVDANLDRMVSSDLNGENLHIVLKENNKISHPFAVGVYKNIVFWNDWTTRGIYKAEMEHINSGDYTATSITQVKANMPRLMDLKTYGIGMQQGSNLCSSEATSNCSHICMMHPNQTVSCVCPDGFVMQNNSCVCPDGKAPNSTGSCESKCEDGRTFKCKTHENYCIINAWRCDGDDDCGDNSDEEGCDVQQCPDAAEFKCEKSGRCIPRSFVCDFDFDCGPGDTSDEKNCTAKHDCDPIKHFQCANARCILHSWVCDDDDDCLDGSDEVNCTDVKNGTFSCLASEWKCPNEEKCLSPDWICDFDNDCSDGADEANCTSKLCPDWKFACKTSGHCVMATWECDGDKDCPDGSDEHTDCPPVPSTQTPENPFPNHGNCSQLSQMFECLGSKECIPVYWKCDNVKDCGDGSDELGCSDQDDDHGPTHVVTLEPERSRCSMDQWKCNDGSCIASTSVCDGFPDCIGKEDESSCQNGTAGGCPQHMRRCGNTKACVFEFKWCDGKKDCPSGDDEVGCNQSQIVQCDTGSFKCDDDLCMPLFKMCNKRRDCYDGTDEEEDKCKNFKPIQQVEGIASTEVDSTWFDVEWWLPAQPSGSKNLKFIPSICEVESHHCTNETEITGRNFTFAKLSPFKKYSVTIYVKDGAIIHPPFVYTNVTTMESEASAPYQLQVRQNSTEDLIITWKKPHTMNGKLIQYKVYFQPPIPPTAMDCLEEKLIISNRQSDPVFLPGENYTFWVTAMNKHGEGNVSELVHYVYNGEVAFLTLLSVKDLAENTVKLAWTTSNDNANSYTVILETASVGSMYKFRNITETNLKSVEFENLSPGSSYKVKVIPKYNGMHGSQRTLAFMTKGGPYPKVEGLTGMSGASGVVKLSWRPPKGVSNIKYGIYYGKTAQELADKRAQISTSLSQAEVTHLEACENYLFDVGIVTDHNGIGPLTEKPFQVKTKMSATAPPKNVQIEHADDDGGAVKVKVSWRAPCDAMDKPIGYNITLREVTYDNLYGVSNVSFSEQNQLHHFLKLQYGGKYELTVSTTAEGGKPSAPITFEGPAIPFPEKIHECGVCDPLAIYWVRPNLPKLVTKKGPESYLVWLSKDENFTNPEKHETSDTSFLFTEIMDSGIYYAAVSVKDADGLLSPRSSPIIIQHTNGASPLVVIPGSSALAITITVLVVIVLLVAVLAVFVIRHKRLQTSFLNFASSHYSSSSGAATFQQQAMEEQDSPVIRGFSDDEPLLVA